MTINEFRAEHLESQVDIVSERGTLLAYRNVGTVIFDLYNIDDFFIEFSYDLGVNEAVTMKIFDDSMQLKPYFSQNAEPEFSLPDIKSNLKVK